MSFHLDIIGIKKNPNGPMHSSLGVVSGTIIDGICNLCSAFNDLEPTPNSFLMFLGNNIL
ncbi:hypothetical protein LguiA_010120 [Lonicera macranthoides]